MNILCSDGEKKGPVQRFITDERQKVWLRDSIAEEKNELDVYREVV